MNISKLKREAAALAPKTEAEVVVEPVSIPIADLEVTAQPDEPVETDKPSGKKHKDHR